MTRFAPGILVALAGCAALSLAGGSPGAWFPILLLLGAPLLLGGGVLIGFASRRQEAELLRRSLDRSAHGVLWIDESGRICEANAVTCAMLGYDRDELIGLHIADVDQTVTREDWAFDWSVLDEPFHFQTTARRRDGRSIHLDIHAAPLQRGRH
ncbi:MAG: PAS domain-containing protein, partial [Phycisphaerales bacterium]|nr:PAS domain-containing protein [Phycisphaerales bacterium]